MPAAQLDTAVKALTDKIIAMSPFVIATGKRAFYEIEGLAEPDAYARAVTVMTCNAVHPDAQEGISAFLQKRTAEMVGDLTDLTVWLPDHARLRLLRVESTRTLRLVDSEPAMSQVQEFLDFCDLVHAQDLDESWSMTWLDALREGRTLIARLGVHTGLDDVPNQIWEVGARDTRAFSLMEFDLNEWTFSQDHVLLWEHQEPFSQLNYRGLPGRHAEVLWNLHERHCSVVGHWIPFRGTSTVRSSQTASRAAAESWPTAPNRCSVSMPTSSPAAISSRIFPIRLDRLTAGMTNTSDGWTSIGTCRCSSSAARPTSSESTSSPTVWISR